MPTPCRLTIEASGEAQGPSGLPTRLVVHGTASRDCTRVGVRVRLSAGGPILLSTQADVHFPPPSTADPLDAANDGTWRTEEPLPPGPTIPCGLVLWVEASCLEGGGACSVAASRVVRCKWMPEAGGGAGDGDGAADDGEGGAPGGAGGWPWPDPPHVACPRFGRAFVTLLLAGLMALVVGVALGNPPLVIAAGALLAAAGVVHWIWRHWCAPNTCYLRGGIAWALKRSIVVGVAMVLLTQSVPAVFLVLSYGAAVGMLVAGLRFRRCPIPRTATPITQLPLW